MKRIRKFNENFFDRLESTLKGKSEKGKLLAEMLKKNNLPEKGFVYFFLYMGGADVTEEHMSHPIGYLDAIDANKGKLKVQNGKLVLTDESLKNKKVVNILPMLDKEKKEGEPINEHGRVWTSCVMKSDYSFDLSKENPELSLTNTLIYNIEKGTWVKPVNIKWEDRTEVIEGEVADWQEQMHALVWNKDLTTTYGEFIEECNKRQDYLDAINKFIKEEESSKTESYIIKNFTKFN